ncbi:ATP/GTP-binding protein [Methanogenium sp. MK-MG]|uniref:AAA family ATPase n=1 Tax=Methanogenium sp. MK-MG TaxID=2599926 RepID=UPI0013EDA3DE|nr:AAA family ATPase [Methanogenium sp. MK-MG]KAF1075091.1 hypothetical protein MKMG_01801 [Methanogenium sp. MK-MG]
MASSYFDEKIDQYFTAPEVINRIKRRYLETSRHFLGKNQQIISDNVFFEKRIQSNLREFDESELLENAIAYNISHKSEELVTDIYQSEKLIMYLMDKDHKINNLNILICPPVIEKYDVTNINGFLDYHNGDFFPILSGNVPSIPLETDFDKRDAAAIVSKLHDKIIENNLIGETLDQVTEMIPYICDIRKTDSGIYISLDGNQKQLPLSSMGDGFISMLKILFLSALAKEGVVVLEEPEVSLHPGYIEVVAKSILDCSKNAQFFISTHSKDFLDSILENAKLDNRLDEIQVIKLYKIVGMHSSKAEIWDGLEAVNEIESINTDLRGL